MVSLFGACYLYVRDGGCIGGQGGCGQLGHYGVGGIGAAGVSASPVGL